jgi:hypothetical protein
MATTEGESVMTSQRELRKMSDSVRDKYLRRVEIGKMYQLALKEISKEFNPEINRLKALRDAKYLEIHAWRDELYESEGL